MLIGALWTKWICKDRGFLLQIPALWDQIQRNDELKCTTQRPSKSSGFAPGAPAQINALLVQNEILDSFVICLSWRPQS
jgi:hypothetical protein